MALFPNLELEAIVQVDDKTRLDATKTFASKDGPAITQVEIKPEASGTYIDVTGTKQTDWFTDWQYSSAGTKTVSIRVNGTDVVTKTLSVVTEVADALFAADSDLISEEPDVLKYVKKGRNSFKDIHREVQTSIVKLLNDKGYLFSDGTKITKDAIVDKTEVREWAKYLALHLIYNAQSNVLDDIFARKSALYDSKAKLAAQTTVLRLDLNKDGIGDINEGVTLGTAIMSRR